MDESAGEWETGRAASYILAFKSVTVMTVKLNDVIRVLGSVKNVLLDKLDAIAFFSSLITESVF
jgi:hypothetical protein